MSLIACLSGPERTRAHVEVALEDIRVPQLPTTGPCPCGCPHQGLRGEQIGHHALMNWVSKLPPYASEEHEKQAKKHKRAGEQGFITMSVADIDELNAAVVAVAKHGWVLRVHYEEPPAPEPSPEQRLAATLDEMRAEIAALKAKVGSA